MQCIAFVCMLIFVVEMALYKAKKAGQTLAAQKKLEEVSENDHRPIAEHV